ncbi:MAG TPA: TetR/AcrR family transcriptional regulator [Ktedonobacteraceae bacterium]|nr:TetR/AcrR family transcriptional regulator [Ktedonobacteraceae bacterium]
MKSKRDRLIAAARVRFYQQGVARTTLADIAQEAQVPLGNVYYHFRTKEALLEAVIEEHIQRLQTHFARWDRDIAAPQERLLALLRWEYGGAASLARYGCPYGSLAQEIDKEETPLVNVAVRMLQTYLDWVEQQFRQLDKDEQEAKDLAFDMIAWLQGSILLSASFRSPALLERKLQRMEQWVRSQ